MRPFLSTELKTASRSSTVIVELSIGTLQQALNRTVVVFKRFARKASASVHSGEPRSIGVGLNAQTGTRFYRESDLSGFEIILFGHRSLVSAPTRLLEKKAFISEMSAM